MRKLLVLLIIIIYNKELLAQIPGCTVTVADNSVATVQAAINANYTTPPSVVCLQPGSTIYTTSSFSAIHPIEIRGAGSLPLTGAATSGGTEIINHRSTGALEIFGYGEDSSSLSNIMLDNITITWDSGSLSGAVGIESNAAFGIGQPPIFHHITFNIGKAPGCVGYSFIINTSHAIIYRNKIITDVTNAYCGSPPGFTGLYFLAADATIAKGFSNSTNFWESASTWGSTDAPTGCPSACDYSGQKNFYLEDNELDGGLADDISGAGRVVFRHNTLNDASMSSHGYDSNPWGARHSETYLNIFNCNSAPMGGGVVRLVNWISQRGGSTRVFLNTFPATDPTKCGNGGTLPSLIQEYYRIRANSACVAQQGWPGSYSDTYPGSHQPGWGWTSGGSNPGKQAKQDLPGSYMYTPGNFLPTGQDGFFQDLEPTYVFDNTNNTGVATFAIDQTISGTCRAMAYSASAKSSGGNLVIPSNPNIAVQPYISSGEDAIVIFADLVGGSTPTISDNCNQTWTQLQTATNTARLTAWHATYNTNCSAQITIAFGTSSAARAGTLIVVRGLKVSPVDKNIAPVNVNSSPYAAPATDTNGSPMQADELVLGYFALATPLSDTISATSPDTWAQACDITLCASNAEAGLQGTSGGSDVIVAVTQRSVTSTISIQPQITDTTNSSAVGLAGTITLMVNGSAGSTNSPLDLQYTDFVKLFREVYDQATGMNPCQTTMTSPFDGTIGTFGTGCGPRTLRPSSTTNGVAYWTTTGSGTTWNNGANDSGCLDIVQSGAWVNCAYVPYTYPHPLANRIGGGGGGNSQSFAQQPTTTVTGQAFSPRIQISLTSTTTDSITLSITGGTCTFTGTNPVTSTGGTPNIALFSLTANALGTNCVITSHDNSDGTVTDITSNTFSIINNPPPPPPVSLGGITGGRGRFRARIR